MILKIYTDGGSKGNPGPAAIGVVFYLFSTGAHKGEEIFTYREDIGIATNNVAEYTAIIRAMEKVKKQMTKLREVESIEFYSDSSLVVNQLKGLFKIKNENIGNLILKVKNLERELAIPISYFQIPREQNTRADGLVNNIG